MDYQIIDHGIEHSQYFQGCGTYGTEYSNVVTGIGDSAHNALEDCLEQLGMCEIDISDINNNLSKESKCDIICNGTSDNCQECELWYHVSVRYNND